MSRRTPDWLRELRDAVRTAEALGGVPPLDPKDEGRIRAELAEMRPNDRFWFYGAEVYRPGPVVELYRVNAPFLPNRHHLYRRWLTRNGVVYVLRKQRLAQGWRDAQLAEERPGAPGGAVVASSPTGR